MTSSRGAAGKSSLIGVLAFQGSFAPHLRALERLGVPSTPVKTAAELAQVDHLILPGGESTAILQSIYSASKQAVKGFTDGLRMELRVTANSGSICNEGANVRFGSKADVRRQTVRNLRGLLSCRWRTAIRCPSCRGARPPRTAAARWRTTAASLSR